jgi:large subunit ribosomal protein L32e
MFIIRSETALTSKRIKFRRIESWRYKRVGENWLRPKGGASRMRKKMKGWPRVVSIGYGTKKSRRGLHSYPHQLEELKQGVEAIRVAAAVGGRKRATIIDKADKLGFKILNRSRTSEKDTEEVQKENTED